MLTAVAREMRGDLVDEPGDPLGLLIRQILVNDVRHVGLDLGGRARREHGETEGERGGDLAEAKHAHLSTDSSVDLEAVCCGDARNRSDDHSLDHLEIAVEGGDRESVDLSAVIPPSELHCGLESRVRLERDDLAR